MFNVRHIRNVVRAIIVVVIAAAFIKIAPTLASHAAGHSSTYSAGTAAAAKSH